MVEFFAGPHLPTTKEQEKVSRRREEVLERLKSHHADGQIKETILGSIDFGLVHNIFTGEFRSGVSEVERGQMLPPIPTKENILFLKRSGIDAIGAPPSSTMTYMPSTGLVLVNTEDLAEALSKTNGLSPKSVFLQILFHELNHVISSHEEEESPGLSTFRVGVQEISKADNQEDPTIDFEFINEAMNEVRSRQLAAKYLRSNPMDAQSRKDAEALDDVYFSPSQNSTYILGPVLLKVLAEKIAGHVGIPTKKVWESFWHAGLNGLRLSSKEVKKVLDLDKIFGRGFTNSLAKFSREDTIQLLIKEGLVEKDVRLRDLLQRSYGIRVAPRGT